VTTLSFPGRFLPNWGNESLEALRRIKVYHGALHGHRKLYNGTIVEEALPASFTEEADSLGGIPFGKMVALEAVAIRNVYEECKGSFSSLLLLPSLKLLQMRFAVVIDAGGEIDRIAKDLAGTRMAQVETLVLDWWCPEDFQKRLRKLLKLFPNLKSLRLKAYIYSDAHGMQLGRLVRTKLWRLSELVVEPAAGNDSKDFGARGRAMLRGLGSGCWALAPVARGCGKLTLRFVARGRDRAEYSCYFFDDKFFTRGIF
jgi:hypothetical protein